MIASNNIKARLFANVIDFFLFGIIMFLFIGTFGRETGKEVMTVSGWLGSVPLLFWYIYFPGMECWKGSTLGHWAVGLKVVDEYGNTPSILATFKRRITDLIEYPLLGIPAFILITKSKTHQRLGDFWADTYVIQENSKPKAPNVNL